MNISNNKSNPPSIQSEKKLKTNATLDNKKMLTKGAMKVFEGLKVSIPMEDLDLSGVLQCKLAAKNVKSNIGKNHQSNDNVYNEIVTFEPTQNKIKEHTKLLQSKMKECKSKLTKIGCKVKDKRCLKKTQNQITKSYKQVCKDDDLKNYDVYDFEETQDNSDILKVNSLSQYRTFINQVTETECSIEKSNEKQTESKNTSNSFEALSVSSASSFSNTSCKQTKADKIITKKKCMIMGRIFKNALKSKCNDGIRDIPTTDNNELITDCVLNCQSSIHMEKPKMSQEELDQLFNKLLNETSYSDANSNTNCSTKNRTELCKELALKQRSSKCTKSKKRPRNNSESTSDDEFNIRKQCRKWAGKKNIKETNNSINLEQELKECIGVASRKSQRKCTSGKQNILVEFWSSDESGNEAVLEIKPIQDTSDCKPMERLIEQNETLRKPQINNHLISASNSSKKCMIPKLPKKHKKPLLKYKSEAGLDSTDKDKSKIGEPTAESLATSRCKRSSANTLYYWSSSSDDELQDMVEVKPIRDEVEDVERPMQHGWIVGDSPKKLVTMLAQAKGKKFDADCVKEQVKSRASVSYS